METVATSSKTARVVELVVLLFAEAEVQTQFNDKHL
jgi:hypothetical protein